MALLKALDVPSILVLAAGMANGMQFLSFRNQQFKLTESSRMSYTSMTVNELVWIQAALHSAKTLI